MADTCTAVRTEAVPELVGALVLLIAPRKAESALPDSRLVADLGYHSISLAELGFTLEDLFEFQSLSQETAMTLERVGDIIDLVVEHVGLGTATLPGEDDVDAVFARYGSSWAVRV